MEAKVFRAMTAWLMSLAHSPRRARERFGDRLIIMIYLWSVINDRPVCWACQQDNWPKDLLDREPPSPSVMSRRLRTVGVMQLFERLLAALSDATGAPQEHLFR